MMWIFLPSDEEEIIEADNKFSKTNYGSRKNFSIETAILEKRLVLDNSMLTTKQMVHNFTDLKSCYNRQLANIGSIIEELAGRNMKVVQMFTKMMPV